MNKALRWALVSAISGSTLLGMPGLASAAMVHHNHARSSSSSITMRVVPTPKSFNVTIAKTCAKGTKRAEGSLTIAGRNTLGQILWTTVFHKVWCYNGNPLKVPGKHTRVTKVLAVTVTPATTVIGAAAGWTWKKLVSGASDNYYFNATSFNTHSGNHSYREGRWVLCPIGITCFDNVYPAVNMNAYWNGGRQFWEGKDRTYPPTKAVSAEHHR
jgi:hypothetical protein